MCVGRVHLGRLCVCLPKSLRFSYLKWKLIVTLPRTTYNSHLRDIIMLSSLRWDYIRNAPRDVRGWLVCFGGGKCKRRREMAIGEESEWSAFLQMYEELCTPEAAAQPPRQNMLTSSRNSHYITLSVINSGIKIIRHSFALIIKRELISLGMCGVLEAAMRCDAMSDGGWRALDGGGWRKRKIAARR